MLRSLTSRASRLWHRPILVAPLILVTLSSTPLLANEKDPSVRWLQEYLRIDTTNPPGNEGAAVDFLAQLLHDHGISTQRFVSATGRTSLLAKLTAPNGSEKPLALLHHIDVVPAGDGWREDPFGGALRDGKIHGRGAIDSKSLGIAHLVAFLEASKQPELLDRELWYLATADEEAGGAEGVGWMVERYPETFAEIGAVLTEAGVNRVINGQLAWWGIEVVQKRPLWLRLSVEGRGGHGSGYHPGSATHVLLRALDRLLSLEHRPRLSVATYRYFHQLVPFHGRGFASLFGADDFDAAQAAVDLAVIENRLHRALLPGMTNYLLDTLQVTTVDTSSDSVNVVAAAARATVDIRLLPDTDQELFLERIKTALGPSVDLEVLLSAEPVSAPEVDPIYRLLENFLSASGPVVPTFIPGTTDARYFRERGIPAYGFSPFLLSGLDSRGIHGVNESIPVEQYLAGVATMVDAVTTIVRAQHHAQASL